MDFKSLRSDKLKLTQEEFANLYGISIQEVQELDKTGKPDMDLIVKIATKSGLDFNTILSYEKPRSQTYQCKRHLGENELYQKRACQAILIPRWNRWTFPMICEKLHR